MEINESLCLKTSVLHSEDMSGVQLVELLKVLYHGGTLMGGTVFHTLNLM